MAPKDPNIQFNAVELHEESVRICDRLVVAYATMQEALRRSGSIPSSAFPLLPHTPSKKPGRGLLL